MRKKYRKKRGIVMVLVAAIVAGMGANVDLSGKTGDTQALVAEAATKSGGTLTIDGNTIDKKKQDLFRGLGAVSCNNSSRLIMDYKEEHPTEYWEIMHWLFDPVKGAGLSHVKVELGCDTDTSSGAEPATMRSKDATKANVRRGAGFMFAHDALTINPDITVDMLCWGMPAWVEKAYKKGDAQGNKARFKWYKKTIDAAYDVWGIKMSYVSANRNERDIEEDWTIYLAKRLANYRKRYDYGKIKIVAADETDEMYVAERMLKNKKYRNAVDVIGCHYNSYMDTNVLKLNQKYKKEIWFSEGASVATDSIFGSNNTDDGVNTSGTNGMLDVANRIIIGMAQSNMTMYEFQPALASYYDGAVYYPKQLLSANSPWNGYYEASAGLVMAMHFTNFIGKGWYRVDSGSFGDGAQVEHCISETKNDYYTATNPSTGDYSTVITNDSNTSRVYQVKVSGLKKAASKVSVWETRSNAKGEAYDAGWLNRVDELVPVQNGSIFTYQVTVKPYSMVTLTTTTGQTSYQQRKQATSMADVSKDTALSLPYRDDYEYKSAYLKRRGGTPRYTCDTNGAFEVVTLEDGNKVLKQKIGKYNVPDGWTAPSDPLTSLGDDTWKDYIVSVDAMLDPNEQGSNYVAVCARYNSSANISQNGYWLKLKQNGKWTLDGNQGRLAKGKISGMAKGRWFNLKLKVQGNQVTAYINHKKVTTKTVKGAVTNSGRVALGSAFYKNYYDNLCVEPIPGAVDHVTRVDNMDSAIQYSNKVKLQQSLSYANYGRTLSKLTHKGDTMSYSFEGTGISLLGSNLPGAKIKVIMDGKVIANSYAVEETDSRAVFYQSTGLSSGKHTMSIQLLNNKELDLDAIEVHAAVNGYQPKKATSVKLRTSKKKLEYGESVKLVTTVKPADAGEDITYTSSNLAVAGVTTDGRVYANGGGRATITATTSSGAKASVRVKVTEIRITPESGILVGVGERIRLKAKFVKNINATGIRTWRSSDQTIAKVDKHGKLTAKKKGNVTITAVAKNGYQAKIVVHVRKASKKLLKKNKKYAVQ